MVSRPRGERKPSRRQVVLRITMLAAVALSMRTVEAQAGHAAMAPEVKNGKARYDSLCVGCHGADGVGTEHAPRLADNPDLRGRPKDRIHGTIAAGFPASGMPPFGSLPAEDLDALSAYVHWLNLPASQSTVLGDAAAGKQYFWNAGKCSTCHMVHGMGSSTGPDLSDIGARLSAASIRNVLTAPDLNITPGYEAATVVTKPAGRTLRGYLRNQTNYDLQLQDMEGGFHLLPLSEVASVTKDKHAAMKPVDLPEPAMQNLTAYLGGLTGVEPGALPAANPTSGPSAIEYDGILHPRLGNWPTYNGNLSANRYSPLTGIDRTNVDRLLLKWIAPMPQLGLEATPIVVDGIMYFSGQNQAYAMDAKTGRIIWRYFRPPTPGLVGDASVGTNRGAAIFRDKIFVTTDNAHLLALNRITGKVMWEVVMPEEKEHYGSTVSPLILNDTVIAGVSGGDWGMRGFVVCYDTATGKLLWRHWTLPGPGEPGIETWGKEWPRLAGGSTWLTGSYDPGTDTLFWPTGNPWPDSDDRDRPGDNLYTNSILALDPHTGKMKWYFQFTPHDTADRDAVEPPVLVDEVYQGQPMKLLLHADRNGFLYVFDRTNGKLLLAKSFLKQLNWATGIGPDGRPQLATFRGPVASRQRKCPDNAANWSSTAFSPTTKLYYFMTIEDCGDPAAPLGSKEANGPSQRYLKAVDIETGDVKWEIAQPGPLVLKTWSGVLGTASGLIFYADPNGAFVAADEKTGKILWHYDTNVGMKGPPMTYAVDGRQYVAVTAGSTLLSFALPAQPASAASRTTK
ncbi:MAG: Pyrrolo-quinoline quinone [Edaphobacter sp.]|nr:Pyrrolo-quinoline quinone [Edaphobacter sp.]